MRRTALLLAVVVSAACSGDAAEPTTTTTTESSTSSSSAPQTLIPGGLVPADPATLIPFEDAEPVLVGGWHLGVASPNGQWLAIQSGDMDRSVSEISLVAGASLDVVASDLGLGEGLVVDDTGRAAWFDGGQLRVLDADNEESLVEMPPAPHDLASSLHLLTDGRIGYVSGSDSDLAPVEIVLVSFDEGVTLETHEVPSIMAGAVRPIDPAQPSRDWIAPAVVWDEARDRVLLISALDNTVVAVDLTSGDSTDHSFDSDVNPDDQGVARDAYLTTTGENLLVATRTLEVSGTGDDWQATDSAADLIRIDTSDWSAETLTQSVWALEPSLDGSHVAGIGASITWSSDSEARTIQSPVYLIDGTNGQPLVGFEGRSGTIADAQFSADGAEMYVVSESEQGTNIDIVDIPTQELAGSLAFTRISLIGEAGLISFHAERDPG